MSEKKKKISQKARNEGGKAKKPPVAVTADGVVLAPMRRFAARTFDYILYLEILTWAMALSGVYLGTLIATLVPLVLAAVVMFCLEPLMLWKLGTTPGKALLGLSVTRKGGEKLRYSDGIARIDGVMNQGLGWMIPIWSQIRMWKSFRRGEAGKPQPWDTIAPVRQRGQLSRWAALFVTVCLALGLLDSAIMLYAELPGNKGDLTVEEFAENFTRQTSIWNMTFSQILDENGLWQDRENGYISSSAAAVLKDEIPFQYTVEDGKLTAITIAAEQTGREEPYLKLPGNQIVVAVSSFVWAQKGAPLWSDERMDLLQEILDLGLGNYSLEQAGVTISCKTETEGFDIVDGALKPQEGAAAYRAAFTFTMELND